MDRIRTKFIIAVTSRLSAAADSNAKTDLIEELSENLYQRYQDLVGSGMGEAEAYERALEDLGDVDELLEYLQSLGPDGELPRQQGTGFGKNIDDILHSVEDIVRETISQTKDAVDQAKVIVRDVAGKLKEKYPNGFDGSIRVHFDDEDDDHGEHPQGEDHEESAGSRDWQVSLGYDRERGGFFCEKGQSRPVAGTIIPSQGLRGVDVKLNNGDVSIHLVDDPQADVSLSGDTEQLELRLSDSGVLSIRPGRTASSSFFFVRGLAAADIELFLPRRAWEFIQICTVNGDVTVDDGLETGRLAVKTASGDLTLSDSVCGEVLFKSASGDLDAENLTGSVQAETMSGEITIQGHLENLRLASMSGDVDVSGSVSAVKASTASGDVTVETETVPESLELNSKSGDCEARLPAGAGFTLHFETISGELNSDFPLVGPMGAKSGDAIYLDGGQRTYRMASVSGDISLRQL